jgi:hypothetical protein
MQIIYNKLPEQLKNVEPKYRFKNNVKIYLLQNVFYSVNEYLSTEEMYVNYMLIL